MAGTQETGGREAAAGGRVCRVRPVGEEVERREFVSSPGGLPRASVALGRGLCRSTRPSACCTFPTTARQCEKESEQPEPGVNECCIDMAADDAPNQPPAAGSDKAPAPAPAPKPAAATFSSFINSESSHATAPTLLSHGQRIQRAKSSHQKPHDDDLPLLLHRLLHLLRLPNRKLRRPNLSPRMRRRLSLRLPPSYLHQPRPKHLPQKPFPKLSPVQPSLRKRLRNRPRTLPSHCLLQHLTMRTPRHKPRKSLMSLYSLRQTGVSLPNTWKMRAMAAGHLSGAV